jgi:hypothetical protein
MSPFEFVLVMASFTQALRVALRTISCMGGLSSVALAVS